MNATECFAYKGPMAANVCTCTNAVRCPLAIGESCVFFKTKAEYVEGLERSEARIATLPQDQQTHIKETYLVPFYSGKKRRY